MAIKTLTLEEAQALDPYDMAMKRQLHEKADEKNRLELRRGQLALTCGGRKPKRGEGQYCRSLAGHGTEHVGWGRCKFCGGNNKGPQSPEAKAKTSQNGRKHGFYSQVLSDEEREAYEQQLEAQTLGLQHEIYLWKAKIMLYLKKWKKRWEAAYQAKLAERFIKYSCREEGCGAWYVKGELEPAPGYCLKCGSRRKIEQIDAWTANHSESVAERYADQQTSVTYSESESGTRTYGHAGQLDDKTLNVGLNTLAKLIANHAKLNQESGDDLLSSINQELQAASAGRVSISWGGKPQTREGAKAE